MAASDRLRATGATGAHCAAAPVGSRSRATDLIAVRASYLRATLVTRLSASRYGMSYADIDDAVQEAFRRALERRQNEPVENHDNVLAHLVTIAVNVCIDRIRRRSRENALSLQLTASASAAEWPEEDASETTRRLIWLASRLRALPDALRDVYVARFVDELSQANTARRLGVLGEPYGLSRNDC
jgi:RNA polymerase sigma-70 factor (ECF subfamily)